MIRKVNPANYNIPMRGNPMLHRNLEWYATEDNKVLGAVILDLIDHDYSWVVLMEGIEPTPGFCCINMEASCPTQEAATIALHRAMEKRP